MCGMIADAKLVFDQLDYAASRPNLAKKAELFGALGKQSLELNQVAVR